MIHNDWKLDNLIIDDEDLTRMVGVLDWEMATVGDPLIDLGTSLGYWVQATDDADCRAPAACPPTCPACSPAHELVAGYCRADGRAVMPRTAVFYEAYGVFRLAVIAQQIYYGCANSKTTNGAVVRLSDRPSMSSTADWSALLRKKSAPRGASGVPARRWPSGRPCACRFAPAPARDPPRASGPASWRLPPVGSRAAARVTGLVGRLAYHDSMGVPTSRCGAAGERRRTVSAYREGDRTIVLIPGPLHQGRGAAVDDTMLERLAKGDKKRRTMTPSSAPVRPSSRSATSAARRSRPASAG